MTLKKATWAEKLKDFRDIYPAIFEGWTDSDVEQHLKIHRLIVESCQKELVKRKRENQKRKKGKV